MNEETCKYENQPNYESEYHRQLERNYRLERENDELKAAIQANKSSKEVYRWI